MSFLSWRSGPDCVVPNGCSNVSGPTCSSRSRCSHGEMESISFSCVTDHPPKSVPNKRSSAGSKPIELGGVGFRSKGRLSSSFFFFFKYSRFTMLS